MSTLGVAESSPSPPHHPRPRARRCPPRADTSLRGGKASLPASRAPTGAGPGTRVGQGKAGRRPRAQRRCGQEHDLTDWLPLLLPRRVSGRSPAPPAPCPHVGARAPPAPSDRTSLPHATRPRLFPHRVSAAAGAARGPGSCSRCCPTEPSPRRRRRHSPIVRMRCKLHMLASDRLSAPGPV